MPRDYYPPLPPPGSPRSARDIVAALDGADGERADARAELVAALDTCPPNVDRIRAAMTRALAALGRVAPSRSGA